MKKVTALLVLVLMLCSIVLLPACAPKKPVLKVYNWADYIDESVLEQFEQEYNCKVQYDTFADNEAMYTMLSAGQLKFDVIFPSDYMIEKLIKEKRIAKLNVNAMDNYKNIDSDFKNLGYDPKNEYSVPYMWGTVGILYNKTMVTETVDSWNILFDTKYKGKVIMLDSIRDGMSVALKKLGYSINERDETKLTAAKNLLIQQKKDGTVLAYLLDETKNKMMNNEAALAVVYSGDAMLAIEKNEDLEYVIPKEGTNYWFDAMAIPSNAPNKELAENFINFMCRADIAKKNVDYICYSTPNKAAFDQLDEEIATDERAYPPQGILDKCEVFHDLDKALLEKYNDMWTEIKGS